MFNLGQTVATSGISVTCQEDLVFAQNIRNVFSRYTKQDWGDLTQGDKDLNDQAVKSGEDRILASYWVRNSTGETHKVYIITERDRSVTTILFSEEY